MVAKQDTLLILLMTMKLGMTFSELSVLFGVHRTTVSSIFYSFIETLAFSTTNFVFWINKSIVQKQR